MALHVADGVGVGVTGLDVGLEDPVGCDVVAGDVGEVVAVEEEVVSCPPDDCEPPPELPPPPPPHPKRMIVTKRRMKVSPNAIFEDDLSIVIPPVSNFYH